LRCSTSKGIELMADDLSFIEALIAPVLEK
jgi:hypothetical protein